MSKTRWNEALASYEQLEFDQLNTLNSENTIEGLVQALGKAKKEAFFSGYFDTLYILGVDDVSGYDPTSFDEENEYNRQLIEKADKEGKSTDTIKRTEIHNAYNSGAEKAANDVASKTGKTIYKEWDATLDEKTRETHSLLSGTIIQLGEYFETIYGDKALTAGRFGVAEEDCNCRCLVRYFTYDN